MNWSRILQSARDLAAVELFTIGGTDVTDASIVTFALILLFTFWLSRLVQRLVAVTLSRSGMADHGTVATLRRLVHYMVLLVGLAIALQMIGISLASLFAAGAVVAVGVGFALQTILENFASGVILLGERSITEGDVLEVDGTLIKVERIGTRSTVARTREDDQLIIPNSTLIQSTVRNYTLSDSVYRVRARVGVSYDSDMKRVEETLRRVGEAFEGRRKDRDVSILLLEFGSSSVDWEVSIWAENPWEAPINRSDLNKAVWWGLKEAGITIAYPQLDLHVVSQPQGKGTTG